MTYHTQTPIQKTFNELLLLIKEDTQRKGYFIFSSCLHNAMWIWDTQEYRDQVIYLYNQHTQKNER